MTEGSKNRRRCNKSHFISNTFATRVKIIFVFVFSRHGEMVTRKYSCIYLHFFMKHTHGQTSYHLYQMYVKAAICGTLKRTNNIFCWSEKVKKKMLYYTLLFSYQTAQQWQIFIKFYLIKPFATALLSSAYAPCMFVCLRTDALGQSNRCVPHVPICMPERSSLLRGLRRFLLARPCHTNAIS